MRTMLGTKTNHRTGRLASRGARLAGGAVLATLSVAYLMLAHHIMFGARIGKVVATIDESAGMGVHAGDVMAVPLVGLGFAMLVAAGAVAFGGSGQQATPWRVATVSTR